ncbi:MAG: dockerin type I repeat-containing protein [Candidatus Zixiibacteriota bacterium]
MKRNLISLVCCLPQFLLAISTLIAVSGNASAHPNDIYWSPLGTGMNEGVAALTIFDGKLIAGGKFTTAGGVEVNRIAAWDGNSWSSLGTGMDNNVYCLAVYDGKLVAGGVFTTAGGVPARNIASWDGSAWMPIGEGMQYPGSLSYVKALLVKDARLIASGEFTIAGGTSANHIASWDGVSWSPLGQGVSDFHSSIWALYEFQGSLYAGGSFRYADGIEVWNIAKWDGLSWNRLGGGIFGDACTIFDFQGKMVVGGYFDYAANRPNAWTVEAIGIANWDGVSWSSLGSGLTHHGDYHGYAYVVTLYENRLIAGGYFTSAGGTSASAIAAWDGLSWAPLGSGLDGINFWNVNAVAVFNGDLVVGGSFISAGGKECNRIAIWSKHGYLCGDANDDGSFSIIDISRIIGYLYKNGLPPNPLACGDADGSGATNMFDVIYLLSYLYKDGPAPACP